MISTRNSPFRKAGLVLSLPLLGLIVALLAHGAPSPSPQPAPSPSGRPIVLDRADLQRQFVRAQKTGIAALKHQQSMELKTLDSAQSAAYREWRDKETLRRRQFFQDHPAGKDRRTYVQDMNARRSTFLQIQKDERVSRVQEQKVQLEAEEELQVRNLKEFTEAVKNGQTPPTRLWPEGQSSIH